MTINLHFDPPLEFDGTPERCELNNRIAALQQQLAAVTAERDRLAGELAAHLEREDKLNEQLAAWESREATYCPEDVGMEEYIPWLEADIHKLRADSAALRTQLREEVAPLLERSAARLGKGRDKPPCSATCPNAVECKTVETPADLLRAPCDGDVPLARSWATRMREGLR